MNRYQQEVYMQIQELYQDELSGKECFTTEMKLRWNEMDMNGHIYYGSYMNYYSEARFEAMGKEALEDLQKRNIGPVIYRAELDYTKELLHPDNIHIVTWVEEPTSKTRVVIGQRIYSIKKQVLVSSAKFYIIFMDINKRRPVAIPNIFREKFSLK